MFVVTQRRWVHEKKSDCLFLVVHDVTLTNMTTTRSSKRTWWCHSCVWTKSKPNITLHSSGDHKEKEEDLLFSHTDLKRETEYHGMTSNEMKVTRIVSNKHTYCCASYIFLVVVSFFLFTSCTCSALLCSKLHSFPVENEWKMSRCQGNWEVLLHEDVCVKRKSQSRVAQKLMFGCLFIPYHEYIRNKPHLCLDTRVRKCIVKEISDIWYCSMPTGSFFQRHLSWRRWLTSWEVSCSSYMPIVLVIELIDQLRSTPFFLKHLDNWRKQLQNWLISDSLFLLQSLLLRSR